MFRRGYKPARAFGRFGHYAGSKVRVPFCRQ
jgi:hypothetical protein